MKTHNSINRHFRSFFIMLFLIIITNTIQAQNKTGYLFFINNEINTFFIESEDSVFSKDVFKNKSYMLFDRLCTSNLRLEHFMNSKIGTRITFEQIILNEATLENKELNFIYCNLRIKKFSRPKKMNPRIIAFLNGNKIEIINRNFNNQIEAIFPFKKEERDVLLAEMDKYYERFKVE